MRMTNTEVAELIGRWAVNSFEYTVQPQKWPLWFRRLCVVFFYIAVPVWFAVVIVHVLFITVMLAFVLAWRGVAAMWGKS